MQKPHHLKADAAFCTLKSHHFIVQATRTDAFNVYNTDWRLPVFSGFASGPAIPTKGRILVTRDSQ